MSKLCVYVCRKYVKGDATKVSAEMNCDKVYINVYSRSGEEESAFICCDESKSQWRDILSYEGFLCSPQVRVQSFKSQYVIDYFFLKFF